MTNQVTCIAIASLIGTAVFAGCSKNTEPAGQAIAPSENITAAHEPVDIPMTDEEITALQQSVANYPDALAKIRSLRDLIRDAIAEGDLHKTHRPLDELDAVLDHVPAAARATNVPKSQWETVNTSAQQLRELFNRLHAQIDEEEKGDYAALSGDIDSALTNLENVQIADLARKP
ncbi:hypothetical protein OAS39_00960 [Pirellulales bacterium]|nr:hypothetical protein [Pirellulales bacterium]